MSEFNDYRYALKCGSETTINPLITALTTDKASDVRRIAADALGKMDDKRAIEPLKEALKDEGDEGQIIIEGKVKDRAFETLETISRKIHQRITIEQNLKHNFL